MARTKKSNLLTDDGLGDDLTAAFLNDEAPMEVAPEETAPAENTTWSEEDDGDLPGQLAVDVYETEENLVIKARTAGVNKEDLDVSISDGILTISGTLSSGDDTDATQWHVQECYWGQFSRTLALPVQVKEEEVSAVLKDGVLTISFAKIKQEQAKKIHIQ